MKKETKIISAITIVFLVVVFTICGLTIKNSPLSGYPRQIHDQNMTVQQFVSQVAPAAQREQKKYGIPASITIAQAGLESQWGNSRLGNKYNNLFGMKASKGEDRVRMYTVENINGKQRYIPQYFAVYQTWDDPIKAHTILLLMEPRTTITASMVSAPILITEKPLKNSKRTAMPPTRTTPTNSSMLSKSLDWRGMTSRV